MSLQPPDLSKIRPPPPPPDEHEAAPPAPPVSTDPHVAESESGPADHQKEASPPDAIDDDDGGNADMSDDGDDEKHASQPQPLSLPPPSSKGEGSSNGEEDPDGDAGGAAEEDEDDDSGESEEDDGEEEGDEDDDDESVHSERDDDEDEESEQSERDEDDSDYDPVAEGVERPTKMTDDVPHTAQAKKKPVWNLKGRGRGRSRGGGRGRGGRRSRGGRGRRRGGGALSSGGSSSSLVGVGAVATRTRSKASNGAAVLGLPPTASASSSSAATAAAAAKKQPQPVSSVLALKKKMSTLGLKKSAANEGKPAAPRPPKVDAPKVNWKDFKSRLASSVTPSANTGALKKQGIKRQRSVDVPGATGTDPSAGGIAKRKLFPAPSAMTAGAQESTSSSASSSSTVAASSVVAPGAAAGGAGGAPQRALPRWSINKGLARGGKPGFAPSGRPGAATPTKSTAGGATTSNNSQTPRLSLPSLFAAQQQQKQQQQKQQQQHQHSSSSTAMPPPKPSAALGSPSSSSALSTAMTDDPPSANFPKREKRKLPPAASASPRVRKMPRKIQRRAKRLRLYLDNDETLASVKVAHELPPMVRRQGWETTRTTYDEQMRRNPGGGGSSGGEGKQNGSPKLGPKNGKDAAMKDTKPDPDADFSHGARVKTLFVKLRKGVREGLRRLSERFDLVISSTGEQFYIEKMCKVFDPEGKLKFEISAGEENKNLKTINRPKPQMNSSETFALDNVELWEERDILLVAPQYDFWERAVSYGGEIADNYFPVFVEIAEALYDLCVEPMGVLLVRKDPALAAAAASKPASPTNANVHAHGATANAAQQQHSHSHSRNPNGKNAQNFVPSVNQANQAALNAKKKWGNNAGPLPPKPKQKDDANSAAGGAAGGVGVGSSVSGGVGGGVGAGSTAGKSQWDLSRPPASRTSDAIKMMRRSVFHGMTIRLLGIPQQVHTDTLLDLGGRMSLRGDPWDGIDVSVVLFTRHLMSNSRSYSGEPVDPREKIELRREIARSEAAGIPVVSWEYVRQSYYQLWAANPESFGYPGMRFLRSRPSGLCDCPDVTAHDRVQAALKYKQDDDAGRTARSHPIPPALFKRKIMEVHELEQWYKHYFRDKTIMMLTDVDVKVVPFEEIGRLFEYAMCAPRKNHQLLKKLLDLKIQTNCVVHNEPLPFALLKTPVPNAKHLIEQNFAKWDFNIRMQDGRSILAVALMEALHPELCIRILEANKYDKKETVLFMGQINSLQQYHSVVNRDKMERRHYERILTLLARP